MEKQLVNYQTLWLILLQQVTNMWVDSLPKNLTPEQWDAWLNDEPIPLNVYNEEVTGALSVVLSLMKELENGTNNEDN